METNRTRVIKLQAVIGTFKSRAAFCRYYDLDTTYIANLINGHRNIGEKTARKLEEKLNKPKGFLDTIFLHPLDEYKSFFDNADEDVKNSFLTVLKALQITQQQQILIKNKKELHYEIGNKKAS